MFKLLSHRFIGRPGQLSLNIGVLLLLNGVLGNLAFAQSDHGFVYVNSNIATPGGNSVFGFHQNGDGSLSPLPGSPYLTGGTGVIDPSLKLGPFDAAQEVLVDPERKLLFTVNSGSNTIAIMDIEPDGRLVPVKGSPFPSNGSDPVSVGLKGDILTVVNKDEDPPQNPSVLPPNYTTFRVNPGGKLISVPHSTVTVALGNSPSQAQPSPLVPVIFGADFLGGLLQSFVLEPNGRLAQNTPTELPESEFVGTSAPHLPLGLAASPNIPILYVGFVTINRVGVHQYDSQGRLVFVRTVADSGMAVCWLLTNRAGTRLYASNTGDHSVSVYDVADPLHPVEIQHILLAGVGSNFEIGLSVSEQYLYVVNQRADNTIPLDQGNGLHTLRVKTNGTLAEVASSPIALPAPPGTRSQGVATY